MSDPAADVAQVDRTDRRRYQCDRGRRAVP
jgi:hypothetical protein